MQKLFSTLALLLTTLLSTAQTEKTAEQLKKEIAAHPAQDTARVNLLIATTVTGLTPAERKEMAAEALLISRKTGYRRGEGFALANLGFATARLGDEKEGDSLLRIAESLATELGDPELIGYVHFRLGGLLTVKDDIKAIDYFLKAEGAFEKSGSYLLLAICRLNIAEIYGLRLTNFPLAMQYNLKAIPAAEKANATSRLASSYIGLGNVYAVLGDYSTALVWLKKAEREMNKSSRNNNLYSNLQNALGEAYRLSGKYPEAIDSYKQAIKFMAPINAGVGESNLADTYLRMDSLSLAFENAFLALVPFKKSGNNGRLGWVYGILGRAYLKKGLPDSSIYFAKQGLDSSLKAGNIETMRDNAEALANAYAFKKDFGNAYKYHLQFVNYRDSMLGTEVKNKTALIQYNNDMGKKEAQITQLNQQKKGQRTLLISALIVLALILITAGLLLRNNRQKQKANKLLQQQKEEIDRKAEELTVQKDNVEMLGEIGRKITSSLSVEKIISTAYDSVNKLMDASVFGIGIYNNELKRLDFPATYENGKPLPFYSQAIDDQNRFGSICFTSGKEIILGDLDVQYKDHIQQVLTPHEGEQTKSIIFLPLTAKEKRLGVITVQSFQQAAYTDYHLYMLRNIAIYTAIALENAESYEELNHTVDNLKATQQQLIQSEKMASLGELTAGIAHEIQNPLNFVNNFSEVTTELAEELKDAVEKNDKKEAAAIADGIIENLNKITHHGKRADSIVKGMLQHSRNSTGKKEPTDINALADEYLRLAYHGLRAKDKTFNATMETHYDDSIDKVNVISQDVGRVILNLFTNAFYAVTEKKALLNGEYTPTVSVTTKKLAGSVQIIIKDNGMGIPQKVLDKIYQPFFSTKPTGQGTGLGLSMSYDIVTKGHGGTLEVRTKEGEYAEFDILLPA